jgi:hypothetical protein
VLILERIIYVPNFIFIVFQSFMGGGREGLVGFRFRKRKLLLQQFQPPKQLIFVPDNFM